MIDCNTEAVISIDEARSQFISGVLVSNQTIVRYMTKGFRGIVLESITANGVRFTSKEAIRRFIKACRFGKREPRAFNKAILNESQQHQQYTTGTHPDSRHHVIANDTVPSS